MVTYGQSQSGHDFIEGIDENGVLEWQSQPSQTLTDSRILDFINHDYNKSNIYLFLRENKNVDYSYLGKLAYVSHDNQRECPVYFKWQILDWNEKNGKISLDKSITDNKELDKKIKETVDDIDLDSIREFLDRINAKYDEEDLSDNMWEVQAPFDDTFIEDSGEAEMNLDEEGYNNSNNESSEIEHIATNDNGWEEPIENQQ